MPPVFRFAPSPNGPLHVGHAYAALRDYDLCRRAGGRFLLRIEDIDPLRSRPEFQDAIYEDLAWLGLTWERPVRRQSEHIDAYRAVLSQLDARALLYPAFMSRSEVAAASDQPGWPRDPDGARHYPPADRGRSADQARARIRRGEPHALRLLTDQAMAVCGPLSWHESGAGPVGETGVVQADPGAWGDVVLARREVPTSYHLSVVVDDALQGVTDIVRGRDLFHATSVHVLLQQLLGYPRPRYHHHRLITGEDGGKLSKSRLSAPLRRLRRDGSTPADIRAMVGL